MSRADAKVFWIASYPKSGNTWVRCLFSSLASKGAAPDLDRLDRICPNGAARAWLDEMLDLPNEDLTPAELTRARPAACRQWAAAGAAPRCLKIHDRYDPRLFPAGITAGIVYIVRDPRDVAPSWADHMNVSLDEAIGRMGWAGFTVGRSLIGFRPQAEQVLGSWSEHVTSWLDQKGGPLLLLLRYEALLADPLGETARLAGFLGLPADPASIGRAVAACRFEALRAAEDAAGFSERPETMTRFFRQGRAGVWRRALSPEQAARLSADHGAVLARLGYDTGAGSGSGSSTG